MTKQCLYIHKLRHFVSRKPPSAFLLRWKVPVFEFLGIFQFRFLWYMFATVVIQSYIFIQTTLIYFLKFCSPNSASRGAARPLLNARSDRPPSMKVRRHHLTSLVLYRSLLNKCASPRPLYSYEPPAPFTPLVTHLHTPWQAIVPLPKKLLYCCFGRTDIWGFCVY